MTDRNDLTYWAHEDTSPLNAHLPATEQIRAVYALNNHPASTLPFERLAQVGADGFDRWLESITRK